MSNGKIVEIGLGHKINDSAFIDVEIGELDDHDELVPSIVSVPRIYETAERSETAEESQARATAHEEFLKTRYKALRQAAYPSIGDGLDAFFHYLKDNENIASIPPETAKWFSDCLAVKETISKE